MASKMATSDVMCPVCRDDLNEPKLLPCSHLVCKSCLLTWLTKQGGQGGCPLCRAPVLKSTGNLKAQVDALPTNMAVMSLVESQQLLQSPHICGVCDDVSATSFCMQCDVKMCKACMKNHQTIPAAKNHEIEALDKLTARRLAERNRATCELHPNKPAELLCPAHQELICILCGTTRHDGCTGKMMIDDAAEEKRAELKQRANHMRQKEQQYNKKIQEVKDMFKAMRLSTKETFDDLQKRVEERRRQVERDIQKQEEATMTSLKSLETSRAAYVSSARTVEHLVESASGGAILAMFSNLTSRMDEVEGQYGGHTHVDIVTLHWQQDQLSTLRDLLAQLGEMRTSTAVSQSQPNTPAGSRGTSVSQSQQKNERASREAPRWLAGISDGTCKLHSDRLAELFCLAHQELICILCGTTSHGNCQDKKTVEDAAQEKRAELKQIANRMRLKEREFNTKIQEGRDMFKVIRKSVNETFDDLQKRVEKRGRQVERNIQKYEVATMTSLMSLETSRAAYVCNARTVEHLVESASDGALLAIFSNLTSRMDEVEQQYGGNTRVDSVTLHWQQDQLSTLRDLLAQLGEVRTSTAVSHSQPKTPAATRGQVKPRRAELARVIKVGNRVKIGPDWSPDRYEDGGGPGTVTEVLGNGFVWVRWDNTKRDDCYRMGRNNCYELDLL